jgi:hypothetical protein
MFEWDEPPRPPRSPRQRSSSRDNNIMGGTMKGGSIHMSEKEKASFHQQQKMDTLQDIRNDFAKMKDMMDCMLRDQQEMKKELDNIRFHNNITLQNKPKTTKPTSTHNNDNKRKVSFETGSKRSRVEESSDSDNAAANNVLLLSQRLDQSDKRLENMTEMFNKMYNSLESICSNQGNNASSSSSSAVVGGNNNTFNNNSNNI